MAFLQPVWDGPCEGSEELVGHPVEVDEEAPVEVDEEAPVEVGDALPAASGHLEQSPKQEVPQLPCALRSMQVWLQGGEGSFVVHDSQELVVLQATPDVLFVCKKTDRRRNSGYAQGVAASIGGGRYARVHRSGDPLLTALARTELKGALAATFPSGWVVCRRVADAKAEAAPARKAAGPVSVPVSALRAKSATRFHLASDDMTWAEQVLL
eukprot:TRINITY_DN458_c0_g1_i1.p2 TRINITY_DN458_c0_g1~~TRINITY_DN458_c0_g1_i1.p2  ORF type:complete len:228 (+),score=67.68 TRINITY_DN458_c0_g1_i1:54-686(+)